MSRHRRLLPRPDLGESLFLVDFLRSETVGGALALVAAGVALLWANLAPGSYTAVRHHQLGPLDVEQWAADGALSVFFFIAGLELKREFLVGSLRRLSDAAVPVTAACCGVAVPAAIFVAVNHGTANLVGWAIPAATDIAFALAVLAVVGSSLPTQLRAFLLTLAVTDDLIVILIIAIFYSSTLSWWWLLAAALLCLVYAGLQRARVRTRLVYLPVVLATWWSVHESGIHATIAGVALGVLTRVLPDEGEARSPAERLENRIGPLSAGVAVPFFALMSAGVVLSSGERLLHDPVVWGVVLGLLVGKPVGVLAGTWVVTRFTRAELDDNVAWRDMIGLAMLAGVGFTVSLLVSDLSFTDARRSEAKVAVLLGSVASAVLSSLVLARRNRTHRAS
ncbi:Na+/H+ antiporter NhaA [Nocardioides terrisoli]|uniref:Na+/H+ antiporter NhaA n=1 Tax=Nocardioides terrisoli TaxID=3388267 RepID=UPI00287BB509|nr:Na+/H+ antiporter NhaA [Nocardioides marmorisolisilvae]